jgi:hypothetical protein
LLAFGWAPPMGCATMAERGYETIVSPGEQGVRVVSAGPDHQLAWERSLSGRGKGFAPDPYAGIDPVGKFGVAGRLDEGATIFLRDDPIAVVFACVLAADGRGDGRFA